MSEPHGIRFLSPVLAALVLALPGALAQCQSDGRTGAPADQARVGQAASRLTWSSLKAPALARAGHTTTLLGDGRVLIAGGAPDVNAEVLDPRTIALASARNQSATTLIPMTFARTHHTATMLLSGQVLLTGGDGGKTAEVFDPITNSFRRTGDLNVARSGASALRLTNGRVLIVGGAGSSDTSTELYDPSGGTFAVGPSRTAAGDGELVLLANANALFVGANSADVFSFSGPGFTPVPPGLADTAGRRAAVRISGGNVVVSGTVPAIGIVGPTSLQTFDPTANAGAGGFSASGAAIPGANPGMSGVLLPNGKVLLTGTSVAGGTTSAIAYDPASDTAVSDAPMPAPHHDQTATILGNGDVLVVGGDQPGADVRPWPGGVLPADTGIAMTTPRTEAVAARLHDGTVLVAGGRSHEPSTEPAVWNTAEVFDPTAKAFTATTGPMATMRTGFAGVVLVSGKVLVSGGADPADVFSTQNPLASAEVYDPVAKTFTAVGSMARGRRNHALTRLPTGKVLVTGGCAASPCVAEIFDPDLGTFSTIDAPATDRVDHGAVMLLSGEVLLVGDATSELFDPLTSKFRPTASQPSSPRSGRTARLLPSGQVFAAGATALTNELYDRASDSWTVTAPMAFAPTTMTWALTPLGDLLMTGGFRSPGNGAESRMVRFDPVMPLTTPPDVVYDATNGRYAAASIATPGASVLVAGGDQSGGSVLGAVFADALLYGDGAGPASRPTLDGIPVSHIVGGSMLTITGERFVSRGSETPLAVWAPDTGNATVQAAVVSFTPTTFSIVAPSSAFHGPGFLQVVTAGVASPALPLALDAAQKGAQCRYDAECASGFCADGVCCDSRCDGNCQACSLRRKKDSADGTCATIAPGTDPDHRCFAGQGLACSGASTCDPNGPAPNCVDGVCCDAPCVGACLSCTTGGKAGTCGQVANCNGEICDGNHNLKKAGAPDIDCSPYRCDGTACKTSCISVNDCTGTAVCTFDGVCAPPPNVVNVPETFLGCAIGRSPSRPTSPALALAVMLGLARIARVRVGRRKRAPG